MLYEIWVQNYYNPADYWMIETKYFETRKEAEDYCRRETEKAENHFYYCNELF